MYAKWAIRNTTVYFIVLGASLALLWVVPMDFFRSLDIFPRVLLSSAYLTLPIFSAGILFIHFFDRSKHKNEALGSNLFGALIGGLLEALSLAIGFKALLIPTALLYGLAFLTGEL